MEGPGGQGSQKKPHPGCSWNFQNREAYFCSWHVWAGLTWPVPGSPRALPEQGLWGVVERQPKQCDRHFPLKFPSSRLPHSLWRFPATPLSSFSRLSLLFLPSSPGLSNGLWITVPFIVSKPLRKLPAFPADIGVAREVFVQQGQQTLFCLPHAA